MSGRAAGTTNGDGPLALVMGDADLVRPLAAAGIPVALFALPDDPARRSRHVVAQLPWIDHWGEPGRLVEALLAFAAAQPEPPVLIPQSDGDLLAVSRHRERLDGPFRLLLSDASLVETMLDKAAFARLSERLALPVPRTACVTPASERPEGVDVPFPAVVKPLTRRAALWEPLAAGAKALTVADRPALHALWPRLAATGIQVLVQEAVPGPERAIESHHAYVAADGAIVADFTGRKIRTYPTRFGYSTAVEITDTADVREIGREVAARLGIRGLVKLDFKRSPAGELRLLEVNPRATLWLHPAAVAGLNLPALLYADLTGRARPPVRPVRAGTRWCTPTLDRHAARESGMSAAQWLRFAARCETRSYVALDDPRPFVECVVLPKVRKVRRRLLRGRRAGR